MAASITRIRPEELEINPFQAIGEEWMLVTAGVPGNLNFMTASWERWVFSGTSPACFCFVRPTRHTFSFINAQAVFSLSFLPSKYRSVLESPGVDPNRAGIMTK
ncbi:MAG: flavin reductase family protein [Marinilabiliales bacterium]|nr:flavin reductase family protein [Marinilabiliales bacterium]